MGGIVLGVHLTGKRKQKGGYYHIHNSSNFHKVKDYEFPDEKKRV